MHALMVVDGYFAQHRCWTFIVLQECLSRFLARLSFYLAFFFWVMLCAIHFRVYSYGWLRVWVHTAICVYHVDYRYIWNAMYICYNVNVNVSYIYFIDYKKWLAQVFALKKFYLKKIFILCVFSVWCMT